MQGFPLPAQVRGWWEDEHPPPGGAGGGDRRITRNHRNNGNRSPYDEAHAADICAEKRHLEVTDLPESSGIVRSDDRNRDPGAVREDQVTESGLSEAKTRDEHEDIPAIPVIPGSAGGEDQRPSDGGDDWEEV